MLDAGTVDASKVPSGMHLLLSTRTTAATRIAGLYLLRLDTLLTGKLLEEKSLDYILDIIYQTSGTGGKTPLLTADCLISFPILLNMFSHESGRVFLLDSTTATNMIEASVRMLQHSDDNLRALSASLLYNYALSLPADISELSDHATQLLCGVVEAIEKDQSETVRQYRLMCVGVMMRRFKEGAVGLVSSLGGDTIDPSWSIIAKEITSQLF
jgi:hypothetical protein